MSRTLAELKRLGWAHGIPSCIRCKVDYLGDGDCGACLFVSRLLTITEHERQQRVSGR